MTATSSFFRGCAIREAVGRVEVMSILGVGLGGDLLTGWGERTHLLRARTYAYVLFPRQQGRNLTQGAYRLGDWKLLLKVWCSGYYSHDLAVIEVRGKTPQTETEHTEATSVVIARRWFFFTLAGCNRP